MPNAVTVRVGSLGRICVQASQAQTDIIVDINGYYNDQGSFHASQDPVRIVDTRPGTPSIDPGKAPVLANSVRQISLSGVPGVTLGQTTAVALNVTAVGPTAAGFLTVFPGPCGNSNIPNASNVNYAAGQVVPNFTVVRVPNSGLICVYSFATTHLLVDLDAVFNSAGTSTLKGTTPTRIVDTRAGTTDSLLSGGVYKTRLVPNQELVVPVVSAAGSARWNLRRAPQHHHRRARPQPASSRPTRAAARSRASRTSTTSPTRWSPTWWTPRSAMAVRCASCPPSATDLLLDLTGYYS